MKQAITKINPQDDDPDLTTHLSLLSLQQDDDDDNQDAISSSQLTTSPVFTQEVRSSNKAAFSQYGLLGGHAVAAAITTTTTASQPQHQDPRLFYNVSAPSSVFICGSQGSGKSHTLSCLLENCLVPCDANVLPKPLTGLVLHYDAFVSDVGGSPCEAAHLSSSRAVQVRVLCPPTNLVRIRNIYSALPNLTVEPLQLDERDLNTKRMLDLMAVSSSTQAGSAAAGGGMPLYLHVVTRILRDLRLEQQLTGGGFDYAKFKSAIANEAMTPGQMAPLQQRLDTLQSFMVKEQVTKQKTKKKTTTTTTTTMKRGISWSPTPGQLTIIDLSCPCVTADAACALFTICVSLFLEQPSETTGRVVALDEAHRYMNQCEGSASGSLTETLLAAIRLQRHIGTRVIISTQEPSISPKLLDLCPVIVVHRFSSPDWFRALKRHVATGDDDDDDDHTPTTGLFRSILALRQGEALLFAPEAIVVATSSKLTMLGSRAIKIRVRKRLTADGGRTVMAQ
ncbi:hypothetical protein L249_4989 [Ophiocordyceps polyrhachis-furcata BCC 54312]|uniref:Zona occludens toxin N-terminal domain-containing protein n=1 Tax=Ophiocordyceps polyrhachis-furcata BCC 54312 TaxID=1330021 RepID=A0A367L367_9HYPO|nr:hypothetical protein L249_4989 [Ophiocordyceps polyrhachis-furcata BCC 54312]